MIIEIDGHFFNPLTITTLNEKDKDVLVFFADSVDDKVYLRFKNWTCYNLAARINELIKECNNE